MFKLIVLYEEPDDAQGFDAYYHRTHLAICRRWPGLRGVSITQVHSTAAGDATPVRLIAEFAFDDSDAFTAAMRSPAGRESQQDLKTMSERFGVRATLLLGSDVREVGADAERVSD